MTADSSLEPLRFALVEALRLLASPAEVQIAALPAWVAVPDEVALNFFDAYDVFPRGTFDGPAAPILEEIAAQLKARDQSSGAAVWAAETLVTGQEWEPLRGLARSALAAMGVPYQAPQVIDSYVQQGPDLWAGLKARFTRR